MIKKLNPNHLKKLLNNECDVILYQEGLSEEGEPLTFLKLEKQKCRFVEKTKVIISPDGKKVELIGKVILLGDISVIPEKNFTVKEIDIMQTFKLNEESMQLKKKRKEVKKISGGQIIINDCIYEIYQASKPRNPDGTVHHTTLELM